MTPIKAKIFKSPEQIINYLVYFISPCVFGQAAENVCTAT